MWLFVLVVECVLKVNDCFFLHSSHNQRHYLVMLNKRVKSTAVEKIQELLLVWISSMGWKITDSVNSQFVPRMHSRSVSVKSWILKLDKNCVRYACIILVGSYSSKCDCISKDIYRSNLLGGLIDSLKLYLLPGVLTVLLSHLV